MRVIAKDAVGWSIAWSVALIVIGVLAIVLPLVAGVAIDLVAGWLLLVGGFVHFLFAWHARGAGAVVWQVVIGLLYVWAGVYLIGHPLAGLIGLTLVLAVYLLIKGVMEFVLAAQMRRVSGGGWLVVDGVVSVVLAVLIWTHLPGSAVLLGALAGIAILFSGFSRLALSMAARRTHVLVV
jgi:uncharacterized membrane protein HdeD (DUF308 family)